ncbi:hypothetical protein ACFSBZ_10610 [Amnibacterium flavum]|uniref:Uncharacterized protein n=1 Tax=Amnibacterium flavum TaxID=2173173 RepID=A0A2V1HVZ0_9MICO|nr:hypothetical protein [Amnibacterium flavum]PVZ95289.1 hypothetical protein DDQ50_01835 [Amnibacterium flavum]
MVRIHLSCVTDTEPTPASPVSGLITKRMDADRGRVSGIARIVVGLGWAAIGALNSSRSPEDALYWWLVAGYVAIAIFSVLSGVATLRARAKRITLFDAEYGVDAGRQPPRA